MSFNIGGIASKVVSAASTLTQKAGTLLSTFSKMKGEADVLQTLTNAVGALTQKAAAQGSSAAEGSSSTQQSGQDYANEALNKTFTEYGQYLATLLGSDANGVMDKIKAKVEEFVKANPNASREDVDKAVKENFNNESLGAKIFKDVIDKIFQETMSRIRESNE